MLKLFVIQHYRKILYFHDIYRQSGQNQANMRSSVLRLKHPLRNTCSGEKKLLYLPPIVSNSFPTDLKLVNSLNNFKHKLKDYFLKKLRNMEEDIFAILGTSTVIFSINF